MSVRVLWNLLNELGKKIRCEALPSIITKWIKSCLLSCFGTFKNANFNVY